MEENEFDQEYNDNQNYILFDDYLNHNISSEERIAFENRLTIDDDFRISFSDYVTTAKRIEQLGYQNLRQKLTKTQNDLKKEGYFESVKNQNKSNTKIKIMKPQNLKWIGIAASLIILIGVVVLLTRKQNGFQGHEKMMAEFYIHPSQKIEAIVAKLESYGMADPSKGRNDSLAMALTFFEKYEWKKAIPILAELSKKYPEELETKYYLGLAYLNIENYHVAIETLKPLTTSENYEIKDNARYYLALTISIFRENDEITKRLLNEIVTDPKSSWSAQAKNMLNMIK